MKKTLLNGLSLILASLLIQACGVSSPERQAPPETFTSLTDEVAKSEEMPEPKVNILFVVDNSGSMKSYQQKMSENIELFAERFFDNARVDYRIGVVPVYDSKYLNDKTVYKPSGLRKMNPLGELVSLKGLSDSSSSSLYITRETPNPKEVLKQTVMIGVQWGPEAEESFSPVLAIMDEERNSSLNQGFYQQDAYLAVIFLTDADDVTPGLSAEEFYQKLVDLKGGDRSKVLIAAALPNLKNHSASCGKDGRGPIQSFPALLAVSSGIHADLCSQNFGATLADFGDQLVQRVAAQKKQLPYTPDITTLKVTYGPDENPEEQVLDRSKGDYTFNPKTNVITLNPYLKLNKTPGAKLRITAKPVSLGNYKSSRYKKL